MPAFLLGVCGHRGDVLPVVDLLRLLNQGEARIGPRTRIFIGASGNYLVAVVADQVLGLQKVAIANILPAPLGGDASADFLMGVVTGAGESSMSLLHFNKLLQSARQRAVNR